MKKLLLLSLSLCAWIGTAAEFPEMTLPAGVGVNIHFVTGNEKDLDAIAAAGFKFVRMDFSWEGTERQKGVYDWSGYDQLTANLERRGLRAIYILDYGSALYEGAENSKNPLNGQEQKETSSPRHPESVAAFAKWAAASAKHFSGKHVVWEIWNEPNIFFWKPKPDVNEYTTLALATAKAVRAAEPGTTIIGPGSSEIPWEFLEKFMSSGVLEYIDGVSVHPYRDYKKSPETAAPDYQRLRGLIEKYAPEARKKMPIISSEWGYTTSTKGVPLDKQAAFIVRQQLSNLLNGVPLSIWYDWKNDGGDPTEWEQNFGTVTEDLTPKPSYIALQTMTRLLSGYHIEQRVTTGNDKDYVLLLKNGAGESKWVAWTMDAPHAASFDFTPVSAVNWKGDKLDEKKLELGMMPIYLMSR